MSRQLWRDLAVMMGIFLLLIALLVPAIHRSRTAARMSSAKNNLKQIGLALHNYHDTHGCFPPGGVIREDGTAMHGWMMSMMPFLDANPFSMMIDYNRPWDSPENVPVYQIQIPSYQIPGRDMSLTDDGYAVTVYQGNPNLLHRNSSIKLRQIRKGTAHNWLAGEVAGKDQPWGYPLNWRQLGTKLCDGPDSFGQPAWDGVLLLLVDGSVHFYSTETSPEILQALAEAPPIATGAQTAVPQRSFKYGEYRWESFDLELDPQGDNRYEVQVLRNSKGMPLRVYCYVTKYFTPEEIEAHPKSSFRPLRFLAQIGPQTNIASALKTTTLKEETTPKQWAANMKLLKSIQQQLPQTDAP